MTLSPRAPKVEFLFPTWLIPSGEEGPLRPRDPRTCASPDAPSPHPPAGAQQTGAGIRRDGGPWRPPMRGSWEEPRKNRVGGAVMTAARTPAGRGGPARPGRAAAERPRPALQKTAAGAPGRSHRAAGAGGGSRTASRPRDPGQPPGRAGTAPCSRTDCAASPSSGGSGAPRPRGPHPLRLRSLPAARSRAARLAGPAPGWGRDSATESAMGRPLGTEQPPEA